MKTLNEIKELVDYCQTDAHFLAYLNRLKDGGIITLQDGDINGDVVSDEFFNQLAEVYGIVPDNAPVATAQDREE